MNDELFLVTCIFLCIITVINKKIKLFKKINGFLFYDGKKKTIDKLPYLQYILHLIYSYIY